MFFCCLFLESRWTKQNNSFVIFESSLCIKALMGNKTFHFFPRNHHYICFNPRKLTATVFAARKWMVGPEDPASLIVIHMFSGMCKGDIS